MNFDEAIKYVKENSFIQSYEDVYDYNLVTDFDDVIELLEKLRQEYAPRIEMTKTQYSFITSEYEQKNVVDAVANLTVDNILKEHFHQSFWEPLTEKQVVQAWLHPETIVVTDSE